MTNQTIQLITEIWRDLLALNWIQILVTLFLNFIVMGITVARYNKNLKQEIIDYKLEHRKREQSAMVAECLAEWSARKTFDNIDQVKRLQKLTWEANLWLPDDLAIKLNNILSHKSKENPKHLLVEIKSYMSGKTTKIKPEDIVHFSLQENSSKSSD